MVERDDASSKVFLTFMFGSSNDAYEMLSVMMLRGFFKVRSVWFVDAFV